MVFDVEKVESMLRDALDEVSGLETMPFTARARVRRNETPFSFKAFSSAVLKHRLRRVVVQELAEELGGAEEVEDVLVVLESESHRGAAPAKPQSSRPFCSTPTPVACPVAAVAKPPPPCPSRRLELRLPSRCFLANASVSPWTWTAWRAGTWHGGQSARFDVLPVEVSAPARTRSGEVTGDAQRPMPRRLKQRVWSEETERASEPRCCAVKKVSARTLHHL